MKKTIARIKVYNIPYTFLGIPGVVLTLLSIDGGRRKKNGYSTEKYVFFHSTIAGIVLINFSY